MVHRLSEDFVQNKVVEMNVKKGKWDMERRDKGPNGLAQQNELGGEDELSMDGDTFCLPTTFHVREGIEGAFCIPPFNSLFDRRLN